MPNTPPDIAAECLGILRDVIHTLVQQNQHLVGGIIHHPVVDNLPPLEFNPFRPSSSMGSAAVAPMEPIDLNTLREDVPRQYAPETVVSPLGAPPIMPPIGGAPPDPTDPIE